MKFIGSEPFSGLTCAIHAMAEFLDKEAFGSYLFDKMPEEIEQYKQKLSIRYVQFPNMKNEEEMPKNFK